MPVLPSYRNQSIDWFLYDGNIGFFKLKQEE